MKWFMLTALLSGICWRAAAQREFYQLKIYQYTTTVQEARLDSFLSMAYLPAMHRAGIAQLGIFKPIANDTAAVKKIVVLIPLRKLDDLLRLDQDLEKDKAFQQNGASYLNAPHTDPPYARMETILLQAFPGMPRHDKPDLQGPVTDRVYELRSYEGATEKIHANKVAMFNTGDEVGLFKRQSFHAVFYAEVLIGCHMPNLMYMTSFDNLEERNKHWKAFGDDPYWKKLSSDPQYQNNVSHIDITLMHPTVYSDL